MTLIRPALAAAALFALSACVPEQGGQNGASSTHPASPQANDTEVLSEADAADLIFLREEEKLARDVYLTLHETWGLNVHQNIAGSEQKHMDKALALLQAHDLPDPVVDDTVGVFQNAELQELYGELVALGRESELAALTVGATIEDLDLLDLDALRTTTGSSDVRTTVETLLCASENHMRAFYGQLESRGASYSPQYITQAELDAILAAPSSGCGGGGGHRDAVPSRALDGRGRSGRHAGMR